MGHPLILAPNFAKLGESITPRFVTQIDSLCVQLLLSHHKEGIENLQGIYSVSKESLSKDIFPSWADRGALKVGLTEDHGQPDSVERVDWVTWRIGDKIFSAKGVSIRSCSIYCLVLSALENKVAS